MDYKRLFLFVVVFFVVSVGVSALSYEYMANNSIVHFWNSYDDYYINLSSGIQLTNVYPDFWTKNVWCIWYIRGALSNEVCNDKVNMAMNITSDNSSFINVTGRRDVSIGAGLNIRLLNFTLTYYLNDSSRNLSIINKIKNSGVNNLSGETGFRWIITNIKISNDTANDFLYINNTNFPLSVPFNMTFRNLTNKMIYLGESVTDGSLWLSWNWTTYFVSANEKNVSLNISFGDLLSGQTKEMNFEWLDAMCSWGCIMSYPSSTKNCQPNEQFTLTGYWQYTGDSCPDTRVLYAEVNNGSWVGLNSTGNLSTSSSQPQVLPYYDFKDPVGTSASWLTTCNVLGNYSVRVSCDGTKTANKSVNVYVPPSCVITNIASSTTLGAASTLCYNFTASNIVFDCASYNMMTENANGSNVFAFQNLGFNNITIKNCNVSNYNNGTIIWNAKNITVYNNTFLVYLNNFAGGNIYGAYISNVSGFNWSNNAVSTFGNCSRTDLTGCIISAYNFYHIASNYSVIKNSVFSKVFKEDHINIEPDPSTVKNVYSTSSFSNWSNNLIASNSLHYVYALDLVTTQWNVFSNLTILNVSNSGGIYLESGNWNNFTNLTIYNANLGVLLYTNNNTFTNTNITNTTYGFYVGNSYYNAGCDCDIVISVYNNTFNHSYLNSSTREIYSPASSSINGNKFYNATLVNDRLSGGMYGVYNWVQVNVTFANGSAAVGAAVNITNVVGQRDNNTITGANGFTTATLITHRNSTTQFEQHSINASLYGNFSNVLSNFSQSRVVNMVFGTSSCVYGGVGNFDVLWSDNCVMNNLYINVKTGYVNVSNGSGVGSLTLNNVTINSSRVMLQSCSGACKFKGNKSKFE